MNKINGKRFWNYAKWDLTINKGFYRTMAIVTMSLVFMVTIMGFFIRLTEWRSRKAMFAGGDYANSEWFLNEALGVEGTAFVLAYLCLIAMIIFAGCINHPLRNKQGRITTLTLPATNKEKFTWHVLLMYGGGFLLCLSSMVLADLFNALLSVVTFGAEGTNSLMFSLGDQFANLAKYMTDFKESDGILLLGLLVASVVVAYLFTLTTFSFGNALKYKYNILITVIALQVIQFVLSVVFFLFALGAGIEFIDSLDEQILKNFIYGFVIVMLVLQTVLILLMWLKSYKLYCKAQVTSAWNK